MQLKKRVWGALAIAPLFIGLSGCTEDNEKGIGKEAVTAAPGIATTTDEALKQGAAAKPDAKAAASAGYPGANKRP